MKKVIYILIAFVILVFFIAPQISLFLVPDLSDFQSVLNHDNTLKALKNTLLVSSVVSLCCLILGIPLAWVLTRTNLPMKDNLRTWFCLPYAVPPFVGAIGWIILANPQSGVLNKWVFQHFGMNLNIYSFWGLVWVETCFLFTFVLLSALTMLDKMDSSLEEAARLSGASSSRIFFDISLPILKPAIISGAILSFLATASSFGVPALIGGPGRIYLLTTQIYTFQRMGTAQGLQMAIAVSALLGIATIVILYTSQLFLANSKNYTVSGKSPRPSLVELGQARVPVFMILLTIFFLIFVLPVFGIFLSALSPVQGSWDLLNLSFNNFYRVLFETEETSRALIQSLLLAASAGVICTMISFFFAYFIKRSQFWGQRFLNIAMSLPFSTPGTVLALALILAMSQGIFGIGPSLYNTLWLILIAYVIKHCSLAAKIIVDAFDQIHPSLEEAAQISGAKWMKVMTSIYLPLLKPALIASIFLVFMPAMSELTMTILLTGPGLETIGTLIFQLQEYSDIGGGGAAVLSCLVVMFILGLNWTLKILSKGRYGL